MSDSHRDPLVRFVRTAFDSADGLNPDAITNRDNAEAALQYGGSDAGTVQAEMVVETVERLVIALELDDSAVRRRAAVTLAGSSPRISRRWHNHRILGTVGTRLIPYLDDSDHAVRRAVRGAIARYELDDSRLSALLTSSIPSERERGLRAAGTRTDLGLEVFDAVLAVLDEADVSVQSNTATTLWYPPDDLQFVPPLLHFADADEPAVRAGALSGLATLVSSDVERTDEERKQVNEHLPALATALTSAFRDENSVVRQRAVSVWSDDLQWMLDEDTSTLSFEERWELATALAAAEMDSDPIIADRASFVAARAVENAYWGESEAIPEIAAFAWERDVPAAVEARGMVADAAAAHPTIVANELDRVLQAFEQSDATPADAQIIATLADHAPDRVAEAVPKLELALDRDDESDLRRPSARALDAIASVRPNTLSVSRADLVEATTDVYADGRLQPERLAHLADVAPERAASALAAACRDRERDRWLGWTIERLGETHPDVVADALEEIADVLPSLETGTVESAAPGIERAAIADPATAAEQAAKFAVGLGALLSDSRNAFARTLHVIGTYNPDALPEAVRPLLDYDPEAAEESPAWPLGIVARDAPAFAFDIASDSFSKHDYRGAVGSDALADLIIELAAGDTETAERAIAAMREQFETESSTSPIDIVDIVAPVAEEFPAVAAVAVNEIVALLASGGWLPHKVEASETLLANVVSERPNTIREAILEHYEIPESFVEDLDAWNDEARKTVVEIAFDD